jgi:hypothetical protein
MNPVTAEDLLLLYFDEVKAATFDCKNACGQFLDAVEEACVPRGGLVGPFRVQMLAMVVFNHRGMEFSSHNNYLYYLYHEYYKTIPDPLSRVTPAFRDILEQMAAEINKTTELLCEPKTPT